VTQQRSAAPKIAVVGGGSYQWGTKIIQDVALNEDLRGSVLTLHDIDPEALDDLYRWGEKMAGLAGADLAPEKTGDLDEALSGADFVVLCISTGGLDAMTHDLEIPARYGVIQTVGDTVGPGGLFRALRNIPVAVNIARAMQERCPEAVMLNLTNPMTTLTRAMSKTTQVRCVGLCHELFSTLAMLSGMFDVPEEGLDVQVAGVNHFIWITRVAVRGRDVTREAFRRISDGEAREIAVERAGDDPDPFASTITAAPWSRLPFWAPTCSCSCAGRPPTAT
jgi:alpha-galactosidase/6-phospho-beta-glucosidase family protein